MHPKSVAAFSVITTRRILIAACLASSATPALAADYWWRSKSGTFWNANINGVTNFTTSYDSNVFHTTLPSSADTIRFAAANANPSSLFTNLGQNFTVNSIHVQAGLGSNAAVSGNTITLASIVNEATSRTLTINSNLLSSVPDFSFNTSTNSSTVSVTSNIAGKFGIRKLGPGRLNLSGNNTYNGILQTSGSINTEIVEGSLSIGTGGTAGSLAGNILNQGTLIFNRSDDIGCSSNIMGNGNITKLGNGLLLFTGNKTGSGTTTISAGTLQIGTQFSFTSNIFAGDIINNAAMIIERRSSFTFNNNISGSGNLRLTLLYSSEPMTYLGTNSSSGTTTISAGTLQIGNGGTTGSISGNIDIQYDTSLIFNRSDNITYSGTLTGQGYINKIGTNTLTLDGRNTSAPSTLVSAGKLILASPFFTGRSISLIGNASLELAPGGSNLLRATDLYLGNKSIFITNDNDLLINYNGPISPLATLLSLQSSNRIISSTDLYGIPTRFVLFEAASLGLNTFAGFTVDSTTVIGKYTYTGDANLDGQVNAFDYSRIDDNFGTPGSFLAGDLNTDGFVDAFDYCLIDDTLGAGVDLPLRGVNNPLRPSGYSSSASTEVFIPEPTSLGLLALAGGLLARRKR